MSIKQIEGYKVYLGKLLGQGTYGSVYEGVNDVTQLKVAIKLLKKASIDADDYLKAALFSQIKILQSVKSPNIVGFQDVMESNQYYYVIQQLCDGDLSNIMKPGVCQPQAKAIDMLTHIAIGSLALVREGIIHRDLKPANIMTKKGVLKIGDFGFAKRVPNKKVGNKTVVGTPLYMSLQILKGQEYSSKADIWAIGFIFYELVHGDTPWTAKSEYELVKKIESKPLKIKEGLGPNTVDFIRRCLEKEEKDRISWDEFFVHPIFNGYFANYAAQNKEFENRLKTVMSELRFKINSQNLDLCKILYSMGYNSSQTEMRFTDFFNFLKTINPTISQSQAVYMFQKTDQDNSGTISIGQIQKQMTKHNISLHSSYEKMPIFEKKQSESFTTISSETEQKLKGCFKKMEEVMKRKGVTLNTIFNSFDKDHSGKMNFKEWKYMISRLSRQFGEEELKAVFDLIDEDKSNTIEFEELNRYYSKVNGIPQLLNSDLFNNQTILDEGNQQKYHMDVQNRRSAHRNIQSNHGNANMGVNNGYYQQPNGIYYPPQVQQYPMPYYMQQYPPGTQQTPGIFPTMQPYGYYQPPNLNPQQSYLQNQVMQSGSNIQNQNNINTFNNQPGSGVFGNFIMNQLSQGLNHNPPTNNNGNWN